MEKVAVARIVKPQGIRGEVKAINLLTNEQAITKIANFYLENENSAIKLQNIRLQSGFVYFSIPQITDRTTAETLRNKQVFVLKQDLQQALGEQEFLVADLLGFTVVGNSGNIYGQLSNVENFGSADVFTLKTQGKPASFVNISGVIQSVNIEQKQLMVNDEKMREVICYED